VLSGTRDDGSAGLATIAAHGGVALVQDPGDALYAGMPTNALAQVPAAIVGTAAELGELIRLRTADDVPWPPSVPDAEPDPVDRIPGAQPAAQAPPPVFGCPTCYGGLYEVGNGQSLRYRCRVGHVWSPQSLLDEQGLALEGALWMALRSLEDKGALARRMAGVSRAHGYELSAARYLARAVLHAGGQVAAERRDEVRRVIGVVGRGGPVDAVRGFEPGGAGSLT